MIFCVLLSIPFSVAAKKNFVEGFLLLKSGDTLKGFLDSHSPKKEFQLVKFKKTRDGVVEEFNSGQLKSYGINGGKQFESVLIGSSEIFFEVMVNGSPGLLFDGEKYFLRMNDKMILLDYYKRKVIVDNRAFMSSVTPYKDTLRKIFSNCPSLSNRISKLEYRGISLNKLVVDYNKCVGTKFSENNNKPWLKINHSYAVGLAYSDLSLLTEDFPNLGIGKMTKSISPILGIMLELGSPRSNSNLRFISEFLLHHNTYKWESSFKSSLANYNYSANLSVTSLKIPLGLKYYFLTQSQGTYVKVGFLSELVLGSSSDGVKTTEISFDITPKYDAPYSLASTAPFKSNMLGYFASFGFVQKKFFFEARFDSTNGYLGIKNPSSSSIFAASILGGIRF
jgi:hypothetical protein